MNSEEFTERDYRRAWIGTFLLIRGMASSGSFDSRNGLKTFMIYMDQEDEFREEIARQMKFSYRLIPRWAFSVLMPFAIIASCAPQCSVAEIWKDVGTIILSGRGIRILEADAYVLTRMVFPEIIGKLILRVPAVLALFSMAVSAFFYMIYPSGYPLFFVISVILVLTTTFISAHHRDISNWIHGDFALDLLKTTDRIRDPLYWISSL